MTAIDLLQTLVRCDTTPGNEKPAIALTRAAMEDLGYDDVTIDDHGNLLGRIGNGDHPALVIDGHIDTIPIYARDRWTHDPLGAEIHNDRLFGVGTTDMKGAIAAFICAGGRVKQSGARLSGTAYLSVSVAEEMMEGATLSRSFHGRDVDWCVIAEPTNLQIATAQRGRTRIEVELRGRLAHAASSHRGVNAAAAMATLTTNLAANPQPSHALLGQRAVNLIDIHSDPNPSISTIPDYCRAHFDVRFLPGETAESILAMIRACIPSEVDADVRLARNQFATYTGEQYEIDDIALAWETGRDSELVAKSQHATETELATYQFCTNGSYFAGTRGIPTIGYGPGDPELAHSVDESISVDQVLRASHGYAELITHLLT